MEAANTSPHGAKAYVGEFSHRLDQRGRVTVPSQWRVAGDEVGENFYFAWVHPEGYLSVFPPAMREALLAKIDGVRQHDVDGQRVLRRLFGNGCEFSCDKQGRVLIPEKLLKAVGIDKDVSFVGSGRTFQIWSSEKYEAVNNEPLDLLSALKQLDI